MEIMRAVALWLLLAAFVAVPGGGRAEDASVEKEYVVTLDHSNFTETVANHDFIVVEFYAPWCGHCQNLAPEYEKAASELQKHDPPITLAKVDANEESNRELAVQFKVQGFPTIQIIRNGGNSLQEYNGPRDAAGIAAYIKKQFGPATVEIKSKEDADLLIQDSGVLIVGLFKDFSGEEFDNFTKIAEKLRADLDFGHTSVPGLLKRGDPEVEKPTIRVLKPFDEPFVDFQSFDLDAVEKFLQESIVPSVFVLDKDPASRASAAEFFQTDKTKVMLFVDFSSEEHADLKSKFKDIAVLFKGNDISFLLADVAASEQLLKFFGLDGSQAPLIFIEKKADQKYLRTNLQADELARWFKKYLDGKLDSFAKSQPIPETNDEPVKVVVYDTLKELVLDSPKNVLLEIYAPWCGHCKRLAPILDEIAVSFKSDENVVIAKLDGTENDVPSDVFKVEGYPAIYFKSSSGKIVQYEGQRSKEGITNFINEQRGDKDDDEEGVSVNEGYFSKKDEL